MIIKQLHEWSDEEKQEINKTIQEIKDKIPKESDNDKKPKCSMCDKEAIAYLIYAKKFVCIDCIDKLLHYCCVETNIK